MIEIILAYGLGIVSVSLVVLANVVLKADKKVNESEKTMVNLQRDYERIFEEIYRGRDEDGQSVSRRFDEVYRTIDSRIDKLEFKMKDQSEYIKNKTSQNY